MGRLKSLLGGGRRRSMFRISGILFNSKEIESLMERKDRVAMEAVGRRLRREIRKNLRMGKRYTSINQIKDPKIRAMARRDEEIHKWKLRRGEQHIQRPLPWRPSKPGAYPKIRAPKSPLKKGIIFSYEPGAQILVVGASLLRGAKGHAPRALEHGGMSNNQMIKKRGYVKKTADNKRKALVKVFRKNIKA